MGHKRKQKSRKIRHISESETVITSGSNPETIEIPIPQPNRLESWLTPLKGSLIILIVGLGVFSSGLKNAFEGDDLSQIVNNPTIRSLSNLKLFFEGSTFYGYTPQGITSQNAPLSGIYYHPLMVTIYSLIDTLFGLHSFYYHLFQLLIYIASAILLFLILKKPFKLTLALVLSILFLVHPLNSQVVYSIPNLQDTLVFFFGILAFYILFTFSSVKSLIPVVLALFLCLLSKETAACFIVVCTLYLVWWDRKRLLPFTGMLLIPLAAYLFLRIHAVGLVGNNHIAPIQSVGLLERFMTVPAIILFYVSKIIYPWDLASVYFWTQTKFSVSHFLIPLCIDGLVVAFIIDQGREIRQKVGKEEYKTFMFFALWTVIGIIPYLQIIPIDGTVNTAWFYISMAGLIGMIGTALVAFRIKTKYILAIGIPLILILGVSTYDRGFVWKNGYSLAFNSVKHSPADYADLDTVGVYYSRKDQYNTAIYYFQRALKVEPSYYVYYNLGVDQSINSQYAAAEKSYQKALQLNPSYANYQKIVENMCITSLLTGTLAQGTKLCENGINRFPKDPELWEDFAFLMQKFGRSDQAKSYMQTAEGYGTINPLLINEVMNDQPIKLNFLYSGKDITIQ